MRSVYRSSFQGEGIIGKVTKSQLGNACETLSIKYKEAHETSCSHAEPVILEVLASSSNIANTLFSFSWFLVRQEKSKPPVRILSHL